METRMSPQAQKPHILIAGIGNIFFGDDAFGVVVAHRLMQRPWPEGVRVVDFGIRGLDFAIALLDGYDAVILVDAMPRGGPPGTIYVLEPELPAAPENPAAATMEAHNMNPPRVFQTAAALGATFRRVVVVGCEPETCAQEFASEMSAPVRSAVDEAIKTIEALVAHLRSGEAPNSAEIEAQSQ
jgi:hydrogenase maturation protease